MARTTIRTEDITASEVTTAKMATAPTNASNLSSGSVPTAQLGNVNTSGLEDDIALLGFKVASNGSLAKYNLVDQTVDDFQDTSGVDASSSTAEVRDAAGKYYYGEGSTANTVTGGTITTYGVYTIHKFTSSGTYDSTLAQDVEVLVVGGGGGGGGSTPSGGGGGGGLVHMSAFSVGASSSTTVTIGGGGAASGDPYTGHAVAGVDSVFGSLTAKGGGGGGDGDGITPSGNGAGGSGGSGGGGGTTSGNGTPQAGGSSSQGSQPGDSGSSGFGFAGGSGVRAGGNGGGGGGGGSGAVGTNGSTGSGGNGGTGKAYTILDGSTSVLYAGGGGGGGSGSAGNGTGGPGGGGARDVDGGANTGGGGGGRAAGGSGIAIIKRATNVSAEGGDMTLVSTTTAAQAAPTKGDIVLTYTNGAGTTTLDTDLTAEISADGGSTWTALALGSEGSTGSHNIATSHDVTISSTITAPYNMAYRVKTLNQSASKTTRIQAVSLGWSQVQTKYSYWLFKNVLPEKDRNKIKRIAKKSGYSAATTKDKAGKSVEPDKKERNTDTAFSSDQYLYD